jgi:hypothetical protein
MPEQTSRGRERYLSKKPVADERVRTACRRLERHRNASVRRRRVRQTASDPRGRNEMGLKRSEHGERKKSRRRRRGPDQVVPGHYCGWWGRVVSRIVAVDG